MIIVLSGFEPALAMNQERLPFAMTIVIVKENKPVSCWPVRHPDRIRHVKSTMDGRSCYLEAKRKQFFFGFTTSDCMELLGLNALGLNARCFTIKVLPVTLLPVTIDSFWMGIIALSKSDSS